MKQSFCFFLYLLCYTFVSAQTAEEALKVGNLKFQQQKFSEAIVAYKQAITLDKKMAKAYHNLGNVQYLLQDYRNALNNFDKAVELSPLEAEPYQTRGAAYIALQKFPQAQKDLEKSIKLKAKNPVAFFHLGELYWAMNKKTEACKNWEKAHTLGYHEAKIQLQKNCNFPKDSISNPAKKTQPFTDLLNSAQTKLEIRDYNGAVRDFTKVLELDAQNAQAFFGRGAAEFAQGNQIDACKDWHKALALGHKEAADMIKDACH